MERSSTSPFRLWRRLRYLVHRLAVGRQRVSRHTVGVAPARRSLGDRFGRRRVFAPAPSSSPTASALCGLAPTSALLGAARALQGVGGRCSCPAAWRSSLRPSIPTTGQARSVPGPAWRACQFDRAVLRRLADRCRELAAGVPDQHPAGGGHDPDRRSARARESACIRPPRLPRSGARDTRPRGDLVRRHRAPRDAGAAAAVVGVVALMASSSSSTSAPTRCCRCDCSGRRSSAEPTSQRSPFTPGSAARRSWWSCASALDRLLGPEAGSSLVPFTIIMAAFSAGPGRWVSRSGLGCHSRSAGSSPLPGSSYSAAWRPATAI